ncbi:MAG: hypothetical protein K0Q78_2415, partial [Cellvibrio sp.]|nr:hypothetical protein [Cellvibrio sp.]
LFRPGELEMYKNFIPPDVYSKYNDTLLTDGDTYKKCSSVIKSSLADYLKTNDQRYKELLTEAVGLFQITFSLLGMQVDQVVGALGIISSQDVSLQRSRKMHEAANNRAGTIGLWKIGDEHASDMMVMSPKTYNHLRRTDFNSGFNLFVARRAALAKITTLVNGNWGPYTKGISSRPKGVIAIRDIITSAGNSPAKTMLTAIQVRAAADSTRDSSNRHQKTTDFYAALSAMDVDNLLSLSAIPGLMDGIHL